MKRAFSYILAVVVAAFLTQPFAFQTASAQDNFAPAAAHTLIEVTPGLSPQINAQVVSLSSNGTGVGEYARYQGFTLIPSSFTIVNWAAIGGLSGIDYTTCTNDFGWLGGAIGGS